MASCVGGIPEVVEDGRCGRLLPPDRKDLWAECFGFLAGRPQELIDWAGAAKRCASRFSLEKSSAQLDDLYRFLIDGEEQQEAA